MQNPGSVRFKPNPFAFPSETDGLFRLLAISIGLITISLSITIWHKIIIDQQPSYKEMVNSLSAPVETWRTLVFVLGVPFPILISGSILFGLTMYFYRRYPSQIILEKRLLLPQPDREEELIKVGESLAEGTDVYPAPTIMIGPIDSEDGQVFNIHNRMILRIGMKLKLMLAKGEYKKFFYAITLHELAHIFNNDVKIAYFVDAMWKAFLIMASGLSVLLLLLTYIPRLINISVWVFLWPILLLPGILVALVKLGVIFAALQFIRRSALRSREIYADLRAASWGAHVSLAHLLSIIKDKKENWWRRSWSFHPKASDRLLYLNDAGRNFQHQPGMMAILGFLVGLILSGQSSITSQSAGIYSIADTTIEKIVGGATFALSLFFFSVLLILLSWMLAMSVGAQIQRRAVLDSVKHKGGASSYFELFLLAAMYQIAFEFGVLIMPYNSLQIDPFDFFAGILRPSYTIPTSSVLPFLLLPLWMFFSIGILFTWLGLIRFVSRHYIGPVRGSTPPTGRMHLTTAIATFLLPILYTPSILARSWLLNQNQQYLVLTLISVLFIFMLLGIIGLIGLICIWMKISESNCCPSCSQHIKTVSPSPFCPYCQKLLCEWFFFTGRENILTGQ
jgi:hypothetical protein